MKTLGNKKKKTTIYSTSMYRTKAGLVTVATLTAALA